MKNYITILFIFCGINSFSQPWMHEYLSTWDNHYIGDIQNDYDSGYLNSIVVAGNGGNNQHQLLNKLDDNGYIVYQKLLGVPYLENACFNIPCALPEGEIVLPGSTWSYNTPEDPTLVKLNACREKVWCTTLINNPFNPDFFWDAVVTEDGSIITFSYTNDIDIEKHRIHLHKFSANGDQIWRKRILNYEAFPLIDDPDPWDLDILSDGSLILTGTCYWPDPGPTQYTYVRMFIAKLDPDGNVEWLYVHGIENYQYSIGQNSVSIDNLIYTAGASVTNYYVVTPYMITVDMAGNLVDTYPITIPSVGNNVSQGGFLISENKEGNFFGSTIMYNDEEAHLAFIQIDTMGNLQDFFMPDDTLELRDAVQPVITKNNSVLIGGVSDGLAQGYYNIFALRLLTDTLQFDSIPNTDFVYDSLCSNTIVSSTIGLDSCRIIVSNDYSSIPRVSPRLIMIPTPVPASDGLIIRYENSLYFRNIKIRCFNETGTLIKEWDLNSGRDSDRLDVANWPAGLYVAVAFSNDAQVGTCKFIVSK